MPQELGSCRHMSCVGDLCYCGLSRSPKIKVLYIVRELDVCVCAEELTEVGRQPQFVSFRFYVQGQVFYILTL